MVLAACGLRSARCAGRNVFPAQIEDVLIAIKRERPDLRLHGFGVKTTALQRQIVHDLLFWADRMARSFAARMRRGGKAAHDPEEAARLQNRIVGQSVQLALFWPGGYQ